VIPLRLFEIPDVIEVHEVPSDEVRMVPESPTATNLKDSDVGSESELEAGKETSSELVFKSLLHPIKPRVKIMMMYILIRNIVY
jgi:hypothetical protein|tara:strand:+ start:779 stop:1030 length:252 start_codon:yes stop_codon:yes gene_type:complete